MATFSILFALAVVVTLVSGIWLFLHLTAVAKLFAGKADVVPSPARPKAPRGRIVFALLVFALGLIATIGMQIVAMTSDASALLG